MLLLLQEELSLHVRTILQPPVKWQRHRLTLSPVPINRIFTLLLLPSIDEVNFDNI